MGMPQPSTGHARLEELAGRWEGEETMYPSQWDPAGGKAVGRTSARMALSGFALITDYQQERDGKITYSGHGVFTFRPKDERWVLHWFDSLGSPPEVFEGRFEGDILTVSHGGPGMHARLTYDLSNRGRLISRMEMSRDGADWNTLFDGSYARKA